MRGTGGATMTSNYFKVRGHGRPDLFFFFDDRDPKAVSWALELANDARRIVQGKSGPQRESLSVYRVPAQGLSGVHVIGESWHGAPGEAP